ncbi:MAG: hypothetical protein K5872_21295 [Rhizobiaceae bacterium]|nr:hypothetical protein [Rhizobiaceae bacterium]MCV0408753.1 hypothetical protein [Rhizobiaceae bacterium]
MFCSSLSKSAAAGLAALSSSLFVPTVSAHEAKSGWDYPFACCSGYDCRAVEPKRISERPEGYVIQPTGEVVAYSDRRVKNSPDGEFHWCSVAGRDDSRTICLFVPPRAF